MIKRKYAKIGSLTLGLALALGAAAPAGAQTIAELQAQINALMAQLAALQGGASASANFTMNLTVGSTGSQVVALQQMLVAQGHLVMPAGVAMGYFGPLTKAAVAKWQAANGVAPAVGYWGPLSRAKANSMGGAPGSTTGGTTVGGSAGISTPGIEGTITVSLNATPAAAKLFEASSNTDVLGIKLEAKTSDIKVERVKLKLDCSTCSPGNDTDFYRKIAGRLHIKDGSTVLASVDLNSTTVVKDGTDYFVTVAGLNVIAPKGGVKVLTVALDAMSNWDNDYDGDTWTVTVPAEGVRGVDGAGINQFGPTTAFSRNFTSEGELADSATLNVSTNVNTPQDMDVVCAQGTSENECDGLELLRADFKAEKDAVTITDLVVDVVRSGAGGATTTTGYLYDGSTLIASDAIDTDGHAGFTFSDIDYVVPKDATRTLTLKVDVDSAANTVTTFAADIDTADVTAENAAGTALTESGSATGESINVRNVGLEVSLVSKSISKSATSIQNNVSTSTVEAQFVVRAKAVGGDIVIGDAGSTTVPFVSNAGGSHDDNPSFDIYRGGAEVSIVVASSTSLTVPSSGVASVGSNSFTIQEGTTVDIPVSFTFLGRTTGGILVDLGSYAVGIQQLNWVSSAGIQESNFMDGNSAWRTSTVQLP